MLFLLAFLACYTDDTSALEPTGGAEELTCPLQEDIIAPIGSIPVVMECLDGYCWPEEWETSGGVLHVQCLTDDAVFWVRWL